MSTSREEAERFVEHLARQWSQIEPDALVELFHPEGTLIHSGMSEPLTREQIPDYFRARLAIVPDYSVQIEQWVQEGDTVFVEWLFKGSFAGEVPPNFRGVHRFTLRGDRAVEAAAFYDTARMLGLIQAAIESGAIEPDALGALTAGQDAVAPVGGTDGQT